MKGVLETKLHFIAKTKLTHHTHYEPHSSFFELWSNRAHIFMQKCISSYSLKIVKLEMDTVDLLEQWFLKRDPL